MKAEVRKELETNVLADRLGLFIDRVKRNRLSLGSIAAVVLALAVVWWWWTSRIATAVTQGWLVYVAICTSTFEENKAAEELNQLAQQYPYRGLTRLVELSEADLLYRAAVETALDTSPQEAKERFRKASQIYEALVQKAKGAPELTTRALLGAARCQEWLGEVERAKFFYEEVVRLFPDSPQAGEAKNALNRLGEPGLGAFYQDWPDRLPRMTRAGADSKSAPGSPQPPAHLPSEGTPNKP
ncbi:MAG: hypothetical protein C4297_00940 [Gemmataceae bacterium]